MWSTSFSERLSTMSWVDMLLPSERIRVCYTAFICCPASKVWKCENLALPRSQPNSRVFAGTDEQVPRLSSCRKALRGGLLISRKAPASVGNRAESLCSAYSLRSRRVLSLERREDKDHPLE